MDSEDWFWTIVFLLIVIGVIVFFASLIMDMSSNTECQIREYDGGEQLFWQGKTVCYNFYEETEVITNKKRKYFVLP